MTTPYDVPADKLIKALTEELKKNDAVSQPEWALIVKAGASRERPPEQPDFWHIRTASILRKIYLKGPVGVSRLRTEYGGKKNRGSKPEKHVKGSGKIIRTILQQLEKAGYVGKKEKKGRKVTPEGQKLLDNLAYKIGKRKE